MAREANRAASGAGHGTASSRMVPSVVMAALVAGLSLGLPSFALAQSDALAGKHSEPSGSDELRAKAE